MIKVEDIPPEVMDVWAVQWAKIPVGFVHYEEMQATVKKYPEWFPWETAYEKIPQPVHDAYRAESEIRGRELWDEYQKRVHEIPQPDPGPFNLLNLMASLMRQSDKNRQYEYEEKARKKILWDKHYSKYKLEYRP